jgi:hypothetical protein
MLILENEGTSFLVLVFVATKRHSKRKKTKIKQDFISNLESLCLIFWTQTLRQYCTIENEMDLHANLRLSTIFLTSN